MSLHQFMAWFNLSYLQYISRRTSVEIVFELHWTIAIEVKAYFIGITIDFKIKVAGKKHSPVGKLITITLYIEGFSLCPGAI